MGRDIENGNLYDMDGSESESNSESENEDESEHSISDSSSHSSRSSSRLSRLKSWSSRARSLSSPNRQKLLHSQSIRAKKGKKDTNNRSVGSSRSSSRRLWRQPTESEIYSDSDSEYDRPSRSPSALRSRSESSPPLDRQKLLDTQTSTEDFGDDDAKSQTAEEQHDIIFKQKMGYMSIFFSLVQTLILVVMVMQCGAAPLDMNPMMGPSPDVLDYWGGKNAFTILDEHAYYRLITPVFLHAGVIHLFGNINSQLIFGEALEREWGTPTWTVIYLVSGIGGSIFSVCFKPDKIGVGSSGAIMGLFGAKLGEIFCRACESRKTPQGRIAYQVRRRQLFLYLAFIVLVMAFSFVPFVDWAAHLGGLLAGFAISFLFFAPKIKTKVYAVIWFCVGLAMNCSMYMFSIQYMLNEIDPADELKDVCELLKDSLEGYECQCRLDNK